MSFLGQRSFQRPTESSSASNTNKYLSVVFLGMGYFHIDWARDLAVFQVSTSDMGISTINGALGIFPCDFFAVPLTIPHDRTLPINRYHYRPSNISWLFPLIMSTFSAQVPCKGLLFISSPLEGTLTSFSASHRSNSDRNRHLRYLLQIPLHPPNSNSYSPIRNCHYNSCSYAQSSPGLRWS